MPQKKKKQNAPTPESLASSGSEHAEQVALFAWAALNAQKYPELRLMFAIPNGGKRDKITAAMLKAEGVKAGTSDIFLPVARGMWHGLFIELKVGKNKPSLEQELFIHNMQQAGYGALCVIGWQAAAIALQNYLTYPAFSS